jgi:hypothetical protein
VVGDGHVAGGAEEALLEGVGSGVGVAAQALAKGVADGAGGDGHDDVEVDVEGDGGGESVDVEGADPLGEALFDAHATGVLLDQELGSGGEVVGDQDGGVLVPEPADGKPADVPVVVGELDAVVVDYLGSAVAARSSWTGRQADEASLST